jgi:hypothetical protein
MFIIKLQKMKNNSSNNQKKPFKIISFFLTVLIPLLALGLSIFIIYKIKSNLPKISQTEEAIKEENALSPSDVSENKTKYKDQIITLKGRVEKENAVCQKKECPENDPCCGCPDKINLYLYDSTSSLSQKTKTAFKLVGEKKEELCQRKPLSCSYECKGWQTGSVYNITGKFFAESPPPGLKISFDHYLEVYSKEFSKKPTLSEKIGNLINDIKQFINKTKNSGSFVLPN